MVRANSHHLEWLASRFCLSHLSVSASIGQSLTALLFKCLQGLRAHTSSLHKGLFGCIVTIMAKLVVYAPSLCRAYFIGNNSPMQQPDLYICCINSLMQYFVSRRESLPLVVNTCGWLKGQPALLTYYQLSIINIFTTNYPQVHSKPHKRHRKSVYQ